MNAVIIVCAIVLGLMALAVYDRDQARAAKVPPSPPFNCRAPALEGEITVITVTVLGGRLIGECEYASTRPSKPRKGG